jgi:trk system potassium uptake protein TrkA
LNIVILGAGHTGASVARNLANEGNDVVVIDTNSTQLRELQDKADIATVTGKGTFPDSLQRANTQDADLLIAVMQQDEDNMLACHIAWVLYGTPRIIARIRNKHYLDYPKLFSKTNIPIDALISPESLVTQYVRDLIEFPGTQQLHHFSNGLVKLVSIDIQENSPAENITLQALHDLAPNLFCMALFQNGQRKLLEPLAHFRAGDRLLYLIEADRLKDSLSLFITDNQSYKRIILAGGGHVGKRVAEELQDEYKLKVIEKDEARASLVSETLDRAMVLCGDVTDRELLTDEGISDTDLFCALTSSDEVNILSSMLAKKLGVGKTICLINKSTYVDMISNHAIDTVFSPERITSANILRYVRKGGVINVCPIHGTSLEVLELVVEGTEINSRIIGLRVDQLELPEEVSVSLVIREEQLFSSSDDIILEARDHLIMIAPQKLIATIENYFHIAI